MTTIVFQYWGIQTGEDFGHMVFNLVDSGVFGKTETDSIEDFRGGYTFNDAFVTPFLPERIDALRTVGGKAVVSEGKPASVSSPTESRS
jgi:hypothetical protein